MRTVFFFLLVTVYESVALKNALSSLKKTARLSSFIDRLALSLPLSYLFFLEISFYLVCPRLAGQGWAGNILGFFRTCVDKKPW